MLDHVLTSLLGGESDVTVERATVSTGGGRPIITYAVPVPYRARTVADGPNFKSMHEDVGAQRIVNSHFYFHGQPPIFNMDRITYQGVYYEARGVEHRTEGNFTYAHGMAVEQLPDAGTGSD